MSLHTDRAYHKAKSVGAASALDYDTWTALVAMPKRELAEIAMHLAAVSTGEYDDAILNGKALKRVLEERRTLANNGLI